MHQPASLKFQVEFPRPLALALVICWCAGALPWLIGWLVDAGVAEGWRLALALLSLLAAGGMMVSHFKSLRSGQLLWDRQAWTWRPAAFAASVDRQGHVLVSLDLQRIMLLRFVSHDRQAQWLWVDRGMDPQQWLALRRALFGYRGQGPAQDALDGTRPS